MLPNSIGGTSRDLVAPEEVLVGGRSLTEREAGELRQFASQPTPSGILAIDFLAALYARYGECDPGAVTRILAYWTLPRDSSARSRAMRSAGVHFSGFIRGTNSVGFRTPLIDPNIANAQTGHFFSFVVWASDGLSELELASAIGHELEPDHQFGATISQTAIGIDFTGEMRSLIATQTYEPGGSMNIGALDARIVRLRATVAEYRRHQMARIRGVPLFMVQPLEDRFLVPFLDGRYTGNSIQDLRCTVAGFVFGTIIQRGSFSHSRHAAEWLERNVLAGSLQAIP